jgi:molybdenum cofactor synthesis domain-containing protein
MSDPITAAVLVIGDEILSGRTKDRNVGVIAERCAEIGIDLREVRIVPDERAEIVGALNALRARYGYVFVTGGIGPTHDDVTAEAVADAFGVPLIEDERAIALLLERVAPENLNAARRKMALIPRGAELVENAISKAPGFWIGNVIVMAGVPAIMQSMLGAVVPRLSRGLQTYSTSISAGTLAEGAYAAPLSDLASGLAGLSIGSYPHLSDGRFHNEIAIRGKDRDAVDAAASMIGKMIESLEQEAG